MMKFLLSLLMVLPCYLMIAQNCVPDDAYADSTGVFPMPYHPDSSPDGGINECAVINQNFEFSFTVAVGDSISTVIFGQEVTFPLDSVTVNSVSGLPDGLNYACVPTSCSFPKNSLGCAVIYGVPLSTNSPGDYPLVISGTAYFPVAPFFFDIEFPGDQFPGEYTLRLLPDDGSECDLVSTGETLAGKVEVSVHPNPADGLLSINVDSRLTGTFNLQVFDLIGQQIHAETVELSTGSNRINYDGGSLADGLYLIVLDHPLGQIAQKLIIQH